MRMKKRMNEFQRQIPQTIRAIKHVSSSKKIYEIFFQWHQTWAQEQNNLYNLYDARFKKALRGKEKINFLVLIKKDELENKQYNLHSQAMKYLSLFSQPQGQCK